MSSTYYNSTFEIIRPGGNILSLNVSSDSDVKSRLKAKTISKTIVRDSVYKTIVSENLRNKLLLASQQMKKLTKLKN